MNIPEMRTQTEITKAHDTLQSQMLGETPQVVSPEDMYMLPVACNVLCWVLKHDHNPQFGDIMQLIYSELDERGYVLEQQHEYQIASSPQSIADDALVDKIFDYCATLGEVVITVGLANDDPGGRDAIMKLTAGGRPVSIINVLKLIVYMLWGISYSVLGDKEAERLIGEAISPLVKLIGKRDRDEILRN